MGRFSLEEDEIRFRSVFQRKLTVQAMHVFFSGSVLYLSFLVLRYSVFWNRPEIWQRSCFLYMCVSDACAALSFLGPLCIIALVHTRRISRSIDIENLTVWIFSWLMLIFPFG